MSDIQPIHELGVDQRDETVTTQQPGYATTEQVTRDVAAERRLGWFQVSRIVRTLLVILEILLGMRFVLHLIAANPDSGFAVFIYGITGVFVAPFKGLIGTPASGGTSPRSDDTHCHGGLRAVCLGGHPCARHRGGSSKRAHDDAIDA